MQTYDVGVVKDGSFGNLGSALPCPPCNIGPLPTPDYASLAAAAVTSLGGGITVFAGQRAEGFYVDLGAIFPNGRRVTDDVVAIELRAVAGVTYPLVDKSFTPDAAASKLTDGLTPANVSSAYLGTFPYLGVPSSGFDNPS